LTTQHRSTWVVTVVETDVMGGSAVRVPWQHAVSVRKGEAVTASEAAHHATPLPPGTPAPDFELPATPDQKVRLSDFRGQPVILVFYPEDWSPVCSDQLGLYQAVLPEFQKYGAELIAISVDSAWSHLAFAKDRNLHFPLLADFEPKGEVAKAYHVYRDGAGTSERALFVIDADGIIRWSYVSPVGINPGADGILRALDELQGREETT
jgi:peroxiredoxin